MMPSYSLFGGRLGSEVTFPELRPADDGIPDWTFRRSPVPPSAPVGRVIGEASSPHCVVSLAKTTQGFRLRHSCSGGLYDIEADGSRIIWTSGEEASTEWAHSDLIGRVLPVALHAGGSLCLHGSGVSVNGAAVGFLAPSGWGKSTLAFSLVNAGAQLLSDDALAIDCGPSILVRPGVQQVRLRQDSASRLLDGEIAAGRAMDGKHVFSALDDSRLVMSATRLAAIYLLSPVRRALQDVAVHRTPLNPSRAAIALVQHAKVGMLLGDVEAPVVFRRAAIVAKEVPVYTLHIVRDLNRMGDVVEQLLDWHVASQCGAGAA